jgi:nucleoside-diphosphate-sugar epimerase
LLRSPNKYLVRGTVRDLKNEKKIKPLKDLAGEDVGRLELVEADLLKEDTWDNAVKGCRYVMHVASPFPNSQPKD